MDGGRKVEMIEGWCEVVAVMSFSSVSGFLVSLNRFSGSVVFLQIKPLKL